MKNAYEQALNNVKKWGSAFGINLGGQPKQMVSPLPENDTLDTPGKSFYVAQNQAREQAAKMPKENFSATLKYPEWMANRAPATAVKGAMTQKPMQTSAGYQQILNNIQRAFKQYGNPPIATQSAQLAQLGEEFQKRGGNPYLPAALTIKETGGLKHQPAQVINNPAGIGPGIKYPNLETAILGGGNSGINGGPQKGMKGVLLGGLYDEYLKTGNLLDFFKVYTPENVHDNPSYKDQIQLMNQLLSMFQE
jgi:hypothetical protein